MGITIGYQGSLDDPARLNDLIADVQVFCDALDWPCEEWSAHYSGVILMNLAKRKEEEERSAAGPADAEEEPWPPGTEHMPLRVRVSKRYPPPLIEETHRGLVVRPPGTSPLTLFFNSQGLLCQLIDIPAETVFNALPDTTHYLAFPLFMKTSGAVESHRMVCMLLRILKKKYMHELEVDDSTGYFESGDERELEKHHGAMSAVLSLMRNPTSLNALLRAADLPELPPDAKEISAVPEVPRASKPAKPPKPVS